MRKTSCISREMSASPVTSNVLAVLLVRLGFAFVLNPVRGVKFTG